MKMNYLLSLPPNLVNNFHCLSNKPKNNWFVASDPEGARVGSGGGTAHLLSVYKKEGYPEEEKKIIIHAGGQSRRLPSYATAGKVLLPVPVFRWSRGQKIDQTLLDIQLPLLEKLMSKSSARQNALIASGDVLIHCPELPVELPDVDVLCLGIWVSPHLASRHGVFFTPRNNPQQLDFMLQKPEHGTIEKLAMSHLFMMDVGVWILSDRAITVLMQKSGWTGDGFRNGQPDFYDLYSEFGTCLGKNPSGKDNDINALSVSILPLKDGVFYHYGTSKELISSTEAIQNSVQDQRSIWHNRVKSHPSLFVQNAISEIAWNETHKNIWVENSCIPSTWDISSDHIFTGVPENTWMLKIAPGICIDIVPIGDEESCIRLYGINDLFSGTFAEEGTTWMGETLAAWLSKRGMEQESCAIETDKDIQFAKLFPVIAKENLTQEFVHWLLNGGENGVQKQIWLDAVKLSANDISNQANLVRLQQQRDHFRRITLKPLAVNYKRSVFYQLDLDHIASEYHQSGHSLPPELSADEQALIRARDFMFRSAFYKYSDGDKSKAYEKEAFATLHDVITSSIEHGNIPRLNIYSDQIIWGRSPARLDLAGGWSDTPPFCMQFGGSVVNLAVEMNGQPPIQIFIRLSSEPTITLRSIDNGEAEVVRTYEELAQYNTVISSFSIPKAALCLAGFHPDFCGAKYKTLKEQLSSFGGGFEMSMLSAIPKGSGLGTSSILGATILGVLSDFCSFSWNKHQIAHRTLILEQLLTAGGGWQDQYGGILSGVKLLESEPGTQEKMHVRWLPDQLFTQTEYKGNWLLYYTGITRVAKGILGEIVRGMFLNQGKVLSTVEEIKKHSKCMAELIQSGDFNGVGKMLLRSWEYNKTLDSGTSGPEIEQIISKIADYALGYKLLGAGGGGFILICAKDNEAAARIQTSLTENPPNSKARFVRMEMSTLGFQLSRS
jgi:galactokinase/mevalonate kinase-like predicted kinase